MIPILIFILPLANELGLLQGNSLELQNILCWSILGDKEGLSIIRTHRTRHPKRRNWGPCYVSYAHAFTVYTPFLYALVYWEQFHTYFFQDWSQKSATVYYKDISISNFWKHKINTQIPSPLPNFLTSSNFILKPILGLGEIETRHDNGEVTWI